LKLEQSNLIVTRTDSKGGWGYHHKAVIHKLLPIEAQTHQISSKLIPSLLIQTFKDNAVHSMLYNNTQDFLVKNPNFSYKLITDDVGIQMIRDNFDIKELWAFKQLHFGAAKGDFLRYMALYLYGGVYMDMDSSVNINLDDYIQTDDEFIFFYDDNMNLEQNCFMVKPRHPIMKAIIDEMVHRIYNKETNIFLATGPTLVTDVFYNTIKNLALYNVTANITKEIRRDCWQTTRFMGGRFVHRSKDNAEFVFKLKGYTEDAMYSNHEYYASNNTLVQSKFYKEELFTKEDVLECTLPDIYNSKIVPKVIYQTWDTKELPEDMANAVELIKKTNPFTKLTIKYITK
jgi:mannosyltransferase OCH1-like enzyme